MAYADLPVYLKIPDYIPNQLLNSLQSKFHHLTGHEGPDGEQMYSSTLSLT
jgi:hypothetical protein